MSIEFSGALRLSSTYQMRGNRKFLGGKSNLVENFTASNEKISYA